MQIKKIIVLSVLLFSVQARPYFEHAQKPIREMNGIKFDDYKEFPEKWRLVTTRFRKDSGEMRFTYANKIAMKTLNSLQPDYPDGAMFAKVAFLTEADPAFPSSAVPSGAQRFQFMLRDKKKFKSTDGWGYALFDQNGNIFQGDRAQNTAACVACHRLVPERDFIFSRPLLPIFKKNLDFHSTANQITKVMFSGNPLKQLPQRVQEFLANESYKEVEMLNGPLREKAFAGTLDEVVPALTERSHSFQRPALLLIDDKNFSLVYPVKNKSCPENQSSYQVFILFNEKVVRNSVFCN